MSSHRSNSLTKEYKGLIESIGKDMQLICTTADTCVKVLKDTPELIDDTYKKSSTEALENLNKIRAELKFELTAIGSVAADPETGEVAKNLQTMFKQQRRQNESPDEISELSELHGIFNAGNSASSSSAKMKARKRPSQNVRDLEVVEEEQGVRMDPLTLRPIKVLVQNKRCKHYYCYETIVGHIKTGPYPRCPIAGCRLPHIREADLEFVN